MKTIFLAAGLTLTAGTAQASTTHIFEYDFMATLSASSIMDVGNTFLGVRVFEGITEITGTMTFSNASPTAGAIPGSVNYAPVILEVDQVPTLAVEVPYGPEFTTVEDGAAPGAPDLIRSASMVPGSLPPGTPGSAYDILFFDASGTAFSGTDLPAPIDPADFDMAVINFVDFVAVAGAAPAAENFAVFNITSMTWTNDPAAVPVPAAAWMLLAGLGALGMARYRR